MVFLPINHVRYFILVKNLDTDEQFLIGKGRKRINNLNMGYLDYKKALHSCEFYYSLKASKCNNIICSVISLSVI